MSHNPYVWLWCIFIALLLIGMLGNIVYNQEKDDERKRNKYTNRGQDTP